MASWPTSEWAGSANVVDVVESSLFSVAYLAFHFGGIHLNLPGLELIALAVLSL